MTHGFNIELAEVDAYMHALRMLHREDGEPPLTAEQIEKQHIETEALRGHVFILAVITNQPHSRLFDFAKIDFSNVTKWNEISANVPDAAKSYAPVQQFTLQSATFHPGNHVERTTALCGLMAMVGYTTGAHLAKHYEPIENFDKFLDTYVKE